MKLAKYEHACFTVEKDGQMLVVDPGNFTTDFTAPTGVVAIIITHEHGDHFDHGQLATIINKNPDAVIIAHPTIVDKLDDHHTKAVSAGDIIKIGDFSLEFFGGQHATIHINILPIPNLGILIDESLYYPGDSFTQPEKPVDVLALPAAAPWLKIGEAMDFLSAVHPQTAFPTHDAILSKKGQNLVDRMLGETAKSIGTVYQRITDPIEI